LQPLLAARVPLACTRLVLALEHDQGVELIRILLVPHEYRPQQARAGLLDRLDVLVARADGELIEVARALIDARTDDANHATGAAARTASGRIITGVNVFRFTGGPTNVPHRQSDTSGSRLALPTLACPAACRGMARARH
jgi:hypothetical protein